MVLAGDGAAEETTQAAAGGRPRPPAAAQETAGEEGVCVCVRALQVHIL